MGKPQRLAVGMVLAALIAVGWMLGWTGAQALQWVRGYRTEVNAFRAAHVPGKIIGLTEAELLSTFGKPASVTPNAGPSGTQQEFIYMMYGHSSVIGVENGVAVRATFLEDQ